MREGKFPTKGKVRYKIVHNKRKNKAKQKLAQVCVSKIPFVLAFAAEHNITVKAHKPRRIKPDSQGLLGLPTVDQ